MLIFFNSRNFSKFVSFLTITIKDSQMINKTAVWTLVFTLVSSSIFAQNRLGQDLNAITTGIPFLLIAPDSRAGAMGDAGAATSPDVNSIHWNPAKYAFAEQPISINTSYIPWLRNIVDDINFANLSGAYKIDDRQSIGASLMYFSLGNITFTDWLGTPIGSHKPNEFSLDFAYALKLSQKMSGGVAFRYAHSNLTGGIAPDGQTSKPGNAYAGDISFFYTNPMQTAGKDAVLNFGAVISNLGSKISYGDNSYEEFIPANLRLGTSYELEIDEYNKIMFALDINKLLVPTPTVTLNDTVYGIPSDGISVPKAVFQSFYDAPGGFSEEMHELMYSLGMEYWYNGQFALRGGYFDEHATKGNRKYFTMGVGVKLNVFSIDFAYLVPSAGRQNPLANTLRFTLGFNFQE